MTAAALSSALLVAWAAGRGVGMPLLGYVTRIGAYVVVAAAVGGFSTLRQSAIAERDRWFDMSNDMVCEASLDGYLTRVNDAWSKCLGYTAAELKARPYGELIHPDDVPATYAAASGLAAGPSEVVNFENRYRTKSGGWRWLLWSARSDGQGIYAVARDITELKELAADRERLLVEAKAMALTDDLTRLPNRRAWDDELERAFARARRDGQPLTVALVDVDAFKEVNDRDGHSRGDIVLRDSAAAWREALRDTDFIARYGGDEFSVLLPGCELDDGLVVIDRLRAATPGGLTCTAGLAMWDRTETGDALLDRADAALYRAKQSGRNCTRLEVGAAGLEAASPVE
jgi:diguanylate cyclase (GGDEF)-like protein/PAS domain S-box-containing protein